MSDDSGSKIPVFDGNSKGYMMWWVRFSAYAVMKNFQRALKVDPDLPAKDSDEPTSEKAAAAKKANEVAMASLTIAFKTESLLNIIFKSMSADWPGGLAHKVVSELKKKYQPEDIMCRVELRRSLNAIKMKKGQDPGKLFEQIYSIQNRSKIEIPEADFVAVILDAASEEYQAVLTSERARLKEDITVTDLEETMRSHWHTLSTRNNKSDADDEGKEIALANVSFGGTCFLCKKKGHRIKDCPEKKTKGGTGTGSKFNGKCNNCGKQGHKGADCWEKAENADKRPKNWKNKEVSAAGVTIDSSTPVEFIMCGVTRDAITSVNPPDGFADTHELLKHPDIWVADSATTVHNTCHSSGVVNVRKDGQAIIMGDGNELKMQEMGDISVTVCDRKGNQKFDAKLMDVAVNPNGPFNLFSTSKLQKEGWILGGDKEAIWLSKGNATIRFDILVSNPKAQLFCAYLKRKTEVAGVGKAMDQLTHA